MCYDKETSIVTYTIGTISSLGLLRSENTAFKMSGAFFYCYTNAVNRIFIMEKI